MKRFRNVFVITFFFFLGFLTYFPSLSAQFLWDDYDFVTGNQYVKDGRIDKFFTAQAVEGAGKVSNYFRPIQFTLYALTYKFVGPNPMFFHSLSIMLHILASIALFSFLSHLSVSLSHRLIVSILFLIHPLQTEAISYVSGLSDPLVALFGFTTLYLFLKQKNVLSIFFFFLTLLSKESGVIFLGILLFLTISKIHRLTVFFPYSIITLLYLIYHKTIEVIDMATIFGDSPYTNSLYVRLATFLSILPQYIGLLLFPKDLYYDRDFSIKILTSPWHLPSFIVLFMLVTVSILIYKNRLSLFFVCCFLFSLLPFSGLVLINGIMYEHYLYLALPFFFLFFFSLFEKHIFSKRFFFLFPVFCFLLIVRSWYRQYDWRDPVRFYLQTLTYVPNSFRVLNNLGLEYTARDQTEEAIDTFNVAIKKNPSIPNPYHNLGEIYLKKREFQIAESYYQKALAIDPYFGYSYTSLVLLYEQTNQPEKRTAITKEITTRFQR